VTVTKIFDLNELAEFFQKKGTLSLAEDLGMVKKDLLSTRNFGVSLISLELGQEIPPHPEPYGACFYVVSGKGVFTIGKEQLEVNSGKMVFVAAEEMRGIKSLERLVLLGIHDPHV
jgi:quercetin dioxygenase-like cupin family protein